MNTIVGLEELVVSLDLELVFLVREGRRVAITGDLNARGAQLRPSNAIIQRTRLKVPGAGFGTVMMRRPTDRRAAPLLVADPLNVEDRQEASNNGDMILDSAPVISDPDSANIGGQCLDWNDLDIDFANFLNSQMNDKIIQYPSSGSSSLVRHSLPSTYQTVQVQQAISAPKVLIPPLPTPNIRSLIQRPKIGTGSQRIANLILHTLKSYPLMMLRYNILPPFIHPGLISSDVENNHMEPLTNCISLVHMISA
jgi:hypothetical protein